MRRATGSIRGVDMRRIRGRSAYIPGRRRPPVIAAILDFSRSRDASDGLVHGGDDEILEHLDVGRIDRVGVDRGARRARCLPVTTARTTPPPAEPSSRAACSSSSTRAMSRCICWGHLLEVASSSGGVASSPPGRTPGRSSRRAKSGTSAAAPAARPRSADLGDLDQVVAPDVAGGPQHGRALGIGAGGRLRARGSWPRSARDRTAQDAAEAVLEGAAPPIGDVAQEELALREAEGDDGPVDGDRPAGLDERLGRRVAADQGRRSRASGGAGRRARRRARRPGSTRRRGGARRARCGRGPAPTAGSAAAAAAGRPAGRVGACPARARRGGGRPAGLDGAAAAAGPRLGGCGRRPRPAPAAAGSAAAGPRAALGAPAAPSRQGAPGAAVAPPARAQRGRTAGRGRLPRRARARGPGAGRRARAGRGRWPRGGERRAASGPTPEGREGIGRRAARQRQVERGAQRLDDLVGEAAQVAAAILERVEDGDPARPGRRRRARGRSRAPSPRRRGRAGRARASAVSSSPPAERSWSRIDSASRMPPFARRATRATAAGSAIRPSASRIRPSLPSMSGSGRGRKSKRWTREITAGRIWLLSVVQKMKRTCGGGSSSVLRRTSQPWVIRWTSSTMKTLVGRSAGAV